MSLRRHLDCATRFAAELSEGAIDGEAYTKQSSSHRVKKTPVSMISGPRDLSSSAENDSSEEDPNGKGTRK